MVINPEQSFIFLHLQKCGGRYINRELARIPGSQLEHGQYAHNSIRVVDPRTIKDWFKFTSFRDPLTWYVSFHNFHKYRVDSGVEGWSVEFIDYKTLDEWIIKFNNCEIDMNGLKALREDGKDLAPTFNFEYCLNEFKLNTYGKFTYYSMYVNSRRHDDLFNGTLNEKEFPNYYEVDKIFDINAFHRIADFLPVNMTSEPAESTLRDVDGLSRETRDFVYEKDKLVYDYFYNDQPHDKMVLD